MPEWPSLCEEALRRTGPIMARTEVRRTDRPADARLETDVTIDSPMLSAQVVGYLFRELVSGRLPQGQRINEVHLARKLGISRNPVREAVRRLEERGLLISAPRRGTFVRSFARDDIDDLFAFRMTVECFAIEQALPRMEAADHAELARIVDMMIAAAEVDDAENLVERDVAFHHRICDLSKNRQTVRAFLNIHAEVRMLVALVDHRFESLHAVAIDHVPVLEALRGGHVGKAQEAMRAHIQDSWLVTVQAYQTHDEPSAKRTARSSG